MLAELIAQIDRAYRGGRFRHLITHLRFPRFRNLMADARVDFSFPLTAFVGQNGSGKSSVLQALYGAPRGKSVATYWFNTELDPIVELEQENRHCFIYSYSTREGEVLKTRINKAGQPDNWDTSEPIARYGMVMGARTPPVEKDVLYLNFRSIPNAFEKAFHRQRPPASGIQDHIRARTRNLQSALAGAPDGRFSEPSHEPPIDLTAAELRAAGNILGKSYESCRLIKHRYFDEWGYSVILNATHAIYTDAFAGSGESAIMLLIYEVSRATQNSLLLLDEPETSLHPGAQARLAEFLLRTCLEKGLQIVLSTHAPQLIDGLPREAVKVFTPGVDGKFTIIQNVAPREAFFYIGQPVGDKTTIRVEDKLTKLLLDELIKKYEPAQAELYDIQFAPGGGSVMKDNATVYAAQPNLKVLMLLDGDEKPDGPIFDPAQLTVGENEDLNLANRILDQRIRDATKMEIKFRSDGGADGGNRAQQRDMKKAYLVYFRTKVHFLPFQIPEEAIWSDEMAEGMYRLVFANHEAWQAFAAVIAPLGYKAKFEMLTGLLCRQNPSNTIEALHRLFLTHWMESQANTLQEFRNLWERIKASAAN